MVRTGMKNDASSAAKMAVMLLCLSTAITSCDNYKEPEPVETHYVNLTELNRDTVVSVANDKLSNSVSLAMEGSISKLAILKFSNDTSFAEKSGIALAPGALSSTPFSLGDFAGERLYIQYLPLSDSTSGTIKIGIVFQ